MKRTTILIVVLLLLSLAACEKGSSTKLTAMKMSDLKVPDNFNYEMNRKVDVNIQGPWRLPVIITKLDGSTIFKTQMNPEYGINMKLSLPAKTKEVLVHYQSFEIKVNVTGGNLNLNFNQEDR